MPRSTPGKRRDSARRSPASNAARCWHPWPCSARTAWTWSARTPRRALTVSRISICSLSGLTGTVEQIAVQAPGGFEWATAPDPTGAAFAEYFPVIQPGRRRPLLEPPGQKRPACPGRYASAGRLDGQLDFAGKRRRFDRHDRLSRPGQPGHRHRGGLRPGFCDGSHAGHAGSGQCGECLSGG